MPQAQSKEKTPEVSPDPAVSSPMKKKRRILLVLDLFVCAALLVGSTAFFVVQYADVTSRINTERETYISEITGKIADGIDSRLTGLKSESTIYESVFAQSSVTSFADCQKLFASTPDDVVFLLADDEGGVYQTSGATFLFSKRDLLVSLIFDRQSSFSYDKTTNNSDFWVFAYPCASHSVDGHNIEGFMVAFAGREIKSAWIAILIEQKRSPFEI